MVNRGELIVVPVTGQRTLTALPVPRVAAIPDGSELSVQPRERRPDSTSALRGRIVDILV